MVQKVKHFVEVKKTVLTLRMTHALSKQTLKRECTLNILYSFTVYRSL